MASASKSTSAARLTATGSPLCFSLAVTDAQPWPALRVKALVQTANGAVPLHKIESRDGVFLNGHVQFMADPLDSMLLRALRQQPMNGDEYVVGTRHVPALLALLRQHSECCKYFESPAVARLRILATPARARLEMRSLFHDDTEARLKLSTRVHYLCPQTSEPLGAPLYRGSSYWIFAQTILPGPELPREPLLKGAFERDGVQEFCGDDACDLLFQARQAHGEFEITFDRGLMALHIAPKLQPALRVTGTDRANAVQADWHFRAEIANGEQAVVEPVELLAAAARGERYLRQGNCLIPVDREQVVACRRQLNDIAAFRNDNGAAVDEGVPELLSWARAKAQAPESPWNLYVAQAVDGAHIIKDDPAHVRYNLNVEDEPGEDTWLTMEPEFDHGGVGLSEDELKELVRQGRKWFRKGNQWIKVDAAALEKFQLTSEKAGLQRWRGRRRQFYYRFKPAARDRITDLFSLSGTVQHSQRYSAFLARLRGFAQIESLPKPAGLTLPLRPYQQQGYQWLNFLSRYDLNGILADDMGLGKTAQTIAQLTRMKEERGAEPSLIVTPTSLADNWRNEFQKFSPGMKVLIYRGSPSRRDRLRGEIRDYDVVLTTYATARNDASLLGEFLWRYVILDEAHFIKNSAAATTKAIKTIPARHRLALTGTPIQNRLTELWSLFDFLMPEFLGRQMRFRETFEEPIARLQSGRAENADEQKQGEDCLERLRERIRPFILRRLKTDVASDLPPKIENDIHCTLCPEQIALYRNFSESAEARQAVDELVSKGADRACTAILAALTALRKICNHADLMYLPKDHGRQRVLRPLPGYQTRSGKLEALGELLQQCREGGHRPLIFCQLTSMLDILGHFLAEQQMTYLRIDGETPGTQRQALVDRFNQDTSVNAFLISTRAGGTGLNLTGADTVIFYDHDWNPANDQQAQDRAYRIGQQRTVNVYRLICKGSLEEKILRRQALKRMLADSIVQHDVNGIKDLTRDELLSLFTLSVDDEHSSISR